MNTMIRPISKIQVMTFMLLVLLLSSCEEVIQLDLNSSSPHLVAEGQIEKDSVGWIRLSYTTDYFTAQQPALVQNAAVSISDNRGNSEIMEYRGNGLYKGVSLKGKENSDYTLRVEGPDFKVQAISRLFPEVKIYSVRFEEQKDRRPGKPSKTYRMNLKFSDDPETVNFYRIKFWINDTLRTNNYTYLKDSYYYTIGDTIEYAPMRISFKPDDRLKIGLYSIDEATYTYYNQLNDVSGSGMRGSSTPYNPGSNFGIGVLGYFMAYSYTTCDAIVK